MYVSRLPVVELPTPWHTHHLASPAAGSRDRKKCANSHRKTGKTRRRSLSSHRRTPCYQRTGCSRCDRRGLQQRQEQQRDHPWSMFAREEFRTGQYAWLQHILVLGTFLVSSNDYPMWLPSFSTAFNNKEINSKHTPFHVSFFYQQVGLRVTCFFVSEMFV